MIKTTLQKYWFNILGTLILCGVFFGLGWWVNERSGSADEQLVEAAYQTASGESIFNQQSSQELSYAAIRGMLSTIDDPYAELIEPEAAQNFDNTFHGKTGVVGLYTTNKNKQVLISIVFPNGAAEQAGLRVGDALLAIDGKDLDAEANSSETGLLLRGVPGSPVHLKIERDGKVLEYDLIRKEQQFVFSQMLADRIGYISLSAYNQTASQQMKQVLENLLQQKPVGLIWDLRNNEGGDMQAAQEILSYFIEDGLLFTAQLTRGRTVAFRAKGGAIMADIPLVVLIDKTTYSAAETSAAAIAETGRGKTVGSTSYGKGVIQATIGLPGKAMLQMTVAKWLSPSGEWYHERGVSAQIAASDDPSTEPDELLQKAIDILQGK
ncbi:MAG: PDZ domain-containing protein [Anaerolineaceae bacterium]|nr:PDZ domain-containing protein [Anaerolineaceae bacterium]